MLEFKAKGEKFKNLHERNNPSDSRYDISVRVEMGSLNVGDAGLTWIFFEPYVVDRGGPLEFKYICEVRNLLFS